MAELKVENVTKQFGHHKAVDAVDFEVGDGEFVVLLGPSGSGKTTILRMIAGLETPDSGSIYIDGEVVNGLSPRERDIAMVFQNYALYPHMKIYDNIALPLRVRKLDDVEIGKRVRATAELLQISGLLEKKPSQISGGEQQRVAVARAVVRNPKVFLFDEPLSNLDAKLRVLARGFLKRLQKELKVTTVYVTHDQAEAMTMADRIAVVDNGRLIQMAHPMEIYQQPSDLFVAGFIGSPPMNLIDGEITRAGTAACFVSGPIRQKVEFAAQGAEVVVLGVRPEDVTVSDGPRPGTFKVRVYVAEPMGSVQYVTVDADGIRLLAQVEPSYDATINKEVYCGFREGNTYFFDRQTGRRLA
ncbi:MAG: ABC transporter ATP-binding protein [Nitrososphaerales archaeon]|nr:ABC transporter ATP-binding protein [Nitrososphaerales archaeon]